MAGKKEDSNSEGSGSESPVQTPEAIKVVTQEANSTLVVSAPGETEPSEKQAEDSSTGADNQESGSPGAGSGKGSGGGKGGGGKGGGGGGSSGKGSSGGKSGASKEKSGEPNKLHQLLQFIGEVVIEFKKVTWPTRDQVFRETLSVLVLVAILTLMVLAFDYVLANAFFTPIENWARSHGGGIGRGYQ